jgi:hypothetical protein
MRKLTIVQLLVGIALIANPVYSADMQDYAKIWKAWGKAGQNAYLGIDRRWRSCQESRYE